MTVMRRYLSILGAVFSFGLVAVALGLTVYGINRGVDWTDETWALSLVASGRNTWLEPMAFQYFVHALLAPFGWTVIATRIVRLIAYVGLALAVSGVSLHVLRLRGVSMDRWGRVLLWTIPQVGTILAWSWPPRYFAYNELVAFGVQTLVLVFIELLYVGSLTLLSRRAQVWLGVALGLAVFIVFFAKFVAFVIALPLTVIAWFLMRRQYRLLSITTSLLTFFVVLGVSVLCGFPLGSYLSAIYTNITDPAVSAAYNHSNSVVIKSVLNVARSVPAMLLFAALAFLSVYRFSAKIVERSLVLRRGATLIPWVAVTGILGALFVYVRITSSSKVLTGRLSMSALALGVGLLVAEYFNRLEMAKIPLAREKRLARWFGILLVIIAPFWASFGTNNLITTHVGFNSTVWFGVLAIGIVILPGAAPGRSIATVFVGSLVAVTITLLALGASVRFFVAPYRGVALSLDTVAVKDSKIYQGILLTAAEANRVDFLAREASRLNAGGVPTMSLDNPGNLLAFNNSGYVSPWIKAQWPISLWSVAHACEMKKPGQLFVLQPARIDAVSKTGSEFSSTLLASCGIQFPKDFTRVSTSNSDGSLDEVTIWEYRAVSR